MASLMKGDIGGWTIVAKPEPDYIRQLSAERRVQTTGAKGQVRSEWRAFGDNHYLDCERQITVAIKAAGL